MTDDKTTEAVKAAMLAHIVGGMSISSAARTHHVAITTVRRALRRYGYPPGRPGWPKGRKRKTLSATQLPTHDALI